MKPGSPPARLLIVKNVDPLPVGLRELARHADIAVHLVDYREISGGEAERGYHGILLTGTDLSPWLYPDLYRAQRELVERCACPVLGICGGFQLLAAHAGGALADAGSPVYGRTRVRIVEDDELFRGLAGSFVAFSKHRHRVSRVPPGFRVLARSVPHDHVYAVRMASAPVYGVQFHPERRLEGAKVLDNFLDIVRRASRPRQEQLHA